MAAEFELGETVMQIKYLKKYPKYFLLFVLFIQTEVHSRASPMEHSCSTVSATCHSTSSSSTPISTVQRLIS